MEKIAVALSGGIDSLYSLLKLHSENNNVLAIHARLLENTYDPSPRIAEICGKFGIEFHRIDLIQEFKQSVVAYFINSYKDAQTPNPCVFCNKHIKFGLLFAKAQELGASKIATGHYANIAYNEQYSSYVLAKALDQTKDQAYFLAQIDKELLPKLVFPLAHSEKKELYAKIGELNVAIPIPKESQEICFIPNDDYKSFILPYLPVNKGDILIKQGNNYKKVGTHFGLWNYTEGQRKGLNISYSEPLYVIERKITENTLILGTKINSLTNTCQADKLNFFVSPEKWPSTIFARMRYRQKIAEANYDLAGDIIRLNFLAKQDITSPGQLLVIYDSSQNILASGSVTSVGRLTPTQQQASL